jgi:predicted nucleotidyltransferase
MINNQQKEIILKLLAPLKPVKVAVFGSYARGENKPDSDLDLLLQLDYSNRISLLDLIGVEQDLTDALGIPVEIATEESLSPYVRPYVEKDLTYILK